MFGARSEQPVLLRDIARNDCHTEVLITNSALVNPITKAILQGDDAPTDLSSYVNFTFSMVQ